jgi:hypothetical protein
MTDLGNFDPIEPDTESDSNDYGDWKVGAHWSAEHDSGYAADEIASGSANLFSIQSYFEDTPNATQDDVSVSDGHTFWLIDVNAGKGNYDLDMDFADPRPTEGENGYDFTLDLSASVGISSASLSTSLDDATPNLVKEQNDYYEWETNPSGFPTSQDDNRGVHFDIEPDQGASGDHQYLAEVRWKWSYVENTADGPIIVGSVTEELKIYHQITVV